MKIGCYLLFLLAVLYACSDNTTGLSYDPSRPVVLNNFFPDSGNISTKFIIEGENFGTNLSKINVFFNEKEAQVLASTGNSIYCLVPRQPGDSCIVSVKIESDSNTFENKKFVYHVTANVSDVAGIPRVNGYKDGPLLESEFGNVWFIALNKYNEILVGERNANRLRLISEAENTVITFSESIIQPGVPGTSPDRTAIYIPENSWATPQANVTVMSEQTGWKARKFVDLRKGPYRDKISWLTSALPDDNGYVYITIDAEQLIRVNINNTSDQVLLPAPGNFLCYNPVDKKIYGMNNLALKRMNLDGTNIELVAGSGEGYADGYGLDAKFKNAQQICTDMDGNIIIADADNSVIRKYDIKTKMVSTVAGTGGKSGYKNGLPEESLFNYPYGVAVDENNVIYVADFWNYCIRKIAIE